jgi:hypothetical protein
MSKAGGGEPSSASITNNPLAIYSKYPVSSQWEFKLKNGETVKGEIYCTDHVADIVVLHDSLQDIRMVSVSAITESRQISEPTEEAKQKLAASTSSSNNVVHAKKALDEREKRAIRLAQDSFKHINPKVCNVDGPWNGKDICLIQ